MTYLLGRQSAFKHYVQEEVRNTSQCSSTLTQCSSTMFKHFDSDLNKMLVLCFFFCQDCWVSLFFSTFAEWQLTLLFSVTDQQIMNQLKNWNNFFSNFLSLLPVQNLSSVSVPELILNTAIFHCTFDFDLLVNIYSSV
jgi:hypothetical protein